MLLLSHLPVLHMKISGPKESISNFPVFTQPIDGRVQISLKQQSSPEFLCSPTCPASVMGY